MKTGVWCGVFLMILAVTGIQCRQEPTAPDAPGTDHIQASAFWQDIATGNDFLREALETGNPLIIMVALGLHVFPAPDGTERYQEWSQDTVNSMKDLIANAQKSLKKIKDLDKKVKEFEKSSPDKAPRSNQGAPMMLKMFGKKSAKDLEEVKKERTQENLQYEAIIKQLQMRMLENIPQESDAQTNQQKELADQAVAYGKTPEKNEDARERALQALEYYKSLEKSLTADKRKERMNEKERSIRQISLLKDTLKTMDKEIHIDQTVKDLEDQLIYYKGLKNSLSGEAVRKLISDQEKYIQQISKLKETLKEIERKINTDQTVEDLENHLAYYKEVQQSLTENRRKEMILDQKRYLQEINNREENIQNMDKEINISQTIQDLENQVASYTKENASGDKKKGTQ